MEESEIRKLALSWVKGLTDKQFTEFFYDAVQGRCTSDSPVQEGHFILADASREPESPEWDIDFVSLPFENRRWVDDAPICQAGECESCGNEVRSWDKRQLCPICNNETYGT